MKLNLNFILCSIVVLISLSSCEKSSESKGFRIINRSEYAFEEICIYDYVVNFTLICDESIALLEIGDTTEYIQYYDLREPLTIDFRIDNNSFSIPISYESFDPTNTGVLPPGNYSLIIHSIDTSDNSVLKTFQKD